MTIDRLAMVVLAVVGMIAAYLMGRYHSTRRPLSIVKEEASILHWSTLYSRTAQQLAGFIESRLEGKPARSLENWKTVLEARRRKAEHEAK